MKVEWIDSLGTDLTVVNAARVSFDKESDWEDIIDPKTGDFDLALSSNDTKLIYYLATHNHFTPFTHCQITLRETVPLFVARQRFKHQVGFTYNEVSRRYVKDDPEFFLPDMLRKANPDKKQGSLNEPVEHNTHYLRVLKDHHNACLRLYKTLLDSAVCPEQARAVLPQSMYTSYYVTGSLYAFARAYNLRSKPDAQLEIQELASMWDSLIRKMFPHSWTALVGKEN